MRSIKSEEVTGYMKKSTKDKKNESMIKRNVEKLYENKGRFQVEYKTGSYVPPSPNQLNNYSPDEIFMNPQRAKETALIIQSKCKEFGISATVVDINITSLALTFALMLGEKVSVKSTKGLKLDFEVALGSEIEMDVASDDTNLVHISVKNMRRPMIGLKSVVESTEFKESSSPLSVAAGIGVNGNPLVIDIAKAPHILIAGTTGSGKSVFIDDILLSILFHATPDEVRLLLIDPKLIELMPYNGIPHLLSPVLQSTEESLDAFLWIEDEMMRRYDSFSKESVKDIDTYNLRMQEKDEKKLPRILIVIDEYMDLMMGSPKEINELIDRIARLGRAAGIHIILATQLPVAKIVTPQIKANIPCRASFTVVDGRESRIILDKTGAERLLGNGDMIFSASDSMGAVHAQAAYVSDLELKNIVKYVVDNN